MFSIELVDEGGGEIRGTFFNEECEKWYPLMEEGIVYVFSGGRIKAADKKY